MGLELVFFYGPPYAGKTLFYLKHFQSTHQRVCPSAIFDDEPLLTLRCLVLKVVAILTKGQSVVLDDENEFKDTRASYINIIKNKVPQCTFVCIEFEVGSDDGYLRCNWAREWSIAQAFLTQRKRSEINILEKEQKLCQWFEEKRKDVPSKSEGFEVSTVKMSLCCDSPFKFQVPALIVQLEVLSREKGIHEPSSSVEKLATVISKWISVNDIGRAIFLGDIQHLCNQVDGKDTYISYKTWDNQCCSCFDLIRERIFQLVLKVEIPVYLALIDHSSLNYPFILPPQPGPIAWLQRLHTLDITHKSSLYICTTEASSKMAQAAGLRTVKAETVLNNPKAVAAVNCRVPPPVPACITESRVCYYGNISKSIGMEIERPQGSVARPTAQIPLLYEARASCGQMNQPYIHQVFALGRSHGICFRSKEVLEKYQGCYEKSASPSSEVLCTPYKPMLSSSATAVQNNSISAISLTNNQQDVNVMCDISGQTQDKNKSQDRVISSQCKSEKILGITSSCIKNLKTEDIEKYALSESRYKKGQEITHLIKDLTAISNTNEELQISCTCTGSQGQKYDVTALVGYHGIKEAKCSCLDSAGKTGHCKHVVAMFLKYIKQKQVPKGEKQIKRHKRKHGCSKKAFGRQNTVYVMSSRELLDTATQILQEHCRSYPSITEEEANEGVCRQDKDIVKTKDILSLASSQKDKEARLVSSTQSSTNDESFLEQKQGTPAWLSSSRPIDLSQQINEETPPDESLLHGQPKRQRKSYGKSILDEMF